MYVPKGVVVERPIQLVNILRADVATLVNRRLLIILEEGAQAKLLICDHAMDEVNFLSTQVAEVFVGEMHHWIFTSWRKRITVPFVSVTCMYISLLEAGYC